MIENNALSHKKRAFSLLRIKCFQQNQFTF
ncbi:Uncharacterised protein [Vibrio cholerae]|nr:Uncharacterised protein [Vibrio cholerae]CSI43816.1 Uncharacterised protein [Vibrio cholerae]CSI76683.1 Uncharacterised protein [Vibrio cholerae]